MFLSHSAFVEDAKVSSFTLPAEEALRKIVRYYNTIRTHIRQCKDETLLRNWRMLTIYYYHWVEKMRRSQRRLTPKIQRKAKDMLMMDGFVFVNNTTRGKRRVWECTFRPRCNTVMHTVGGKVVYRSGYHNHRRPTCAPSGVYGVHQHTIPGEEPTLPASPTPSSDNEPTPSPESVVCTPGSSPPVSPSGEDSDSQELVMCEPDINSD